MQINPGGLYCNGVEARSAESVSRFAYGRPIIGANDTAVCIPIGLTLLITVAALVAFLIVNVISQEASISIPCRYCD